MSAQPSHEVDLDVRQLVLDVVNRKVRGLDTRIDGSLTGGTLERTIEGASTLTLNVHDPRRALLRSGAFGYAIDVRLDRLYFRLVKIAKQDDDLTLTFEDREVALLRQQRKPRKAARSKVTRAEFALSLVREVKPRIPFVCPQLHVKQPITNARQAPTPAQKKVTKAQGIVTGARLTIKGARATQHQLALAERVLDCADSFNAGGKATLAVMEACIVESLVQNLSGGDRDSAGILQVRASTARGMWIDNRNVEQCVTAFLRRGFTGRGGAIALSRSHPDWSAGRIAQAVQGSAFPDRYDKAQAEANAIIEAYGGAGLAGGATTGTVNVQQTVTQVPYQYRRGGTDGKWETSWDCLQRLAQEVNWRCFMTAGSLYFMDDQELLKARPRVLITEDSPAVLGIDFDLDTGKKANEATLTARVNRWQAGPGTVVQLSGCGPADGRWLVTDISRGLFDATATIQLKRATKPLPEPAADTVTSTTDPTSMARSLGSVSGGQADRALHAARTISEKRYPYVWGGGHGAAGTPSGGPPVGYDCSGSVVAVLAAAGMGYRLGGGTDVSGNIARSWGQPGPGQRITVWANDIHVWMTIDGKHFGTGDWGKGWGGAGFNPRMHPTAGFTPRHWPGT